MYEPEKFKIFEESVNKIIETFKNYKLGSAIKKCLREAHVAEVSCSKLIFFFILADLRYVNFP